jgi:hypothetical protein
MGEALIQTHLALGKPEALTEEILIVFKAGHAAPEIAAVLIMPKNSAVRRLAHPRMGWAAPGGEILVDALGKEEAWRLMGFSQPIFVGPSAALTAVASPTVSVCACLNWSICRVARHADFDGVGFMVAFFGLARAPHWATVTGRSVPTNRRSAPSIDRGSA